MTSLTHAVRVGRSKILAAAKSHSASRGCTARLLALGICGLMSVFTAMVKAETVTYYYTNPQGTPLATADASGNILSTADYKAFGARALGPPESGPGYTGHVNDADSGLVYMQARYYDPLVGRFLSVDPVSPKPGSVSESSRFAYVNNNPINVTDPTGKCPPCAAAPELIVVGGVVLATGAGVATYMIVDRINAMQPGIAPIAISEAPTTDEAKGKILEGTAPAIGNSGKNGEREGPPGGEKDAWDKIGGTESVKDNGTRVKPLSDGGVADLHSSTKSSYPQGTPSIKITDASGKVVGTVRYPKPTPPSTPNP